jgi:hypothetical protein
LLTGDCRPGDPSPGEARRRRYPGSPSMNQVWKSGTMPCRNEPCNGRSPVSSSGASGDWGWRGKICPSVAVQGWRVEGDPSAELRPSRGGEVRLLPAIRSLNAQDNNFTTFLLRAGGHNPRPGDVNGDGKADVAPAASSDVKSPRDLATGQASGKRQAASANEKSGSHKGETQPNE